LIAATLPEHIAAIVGPDEIEGMRQRLLAWQPSDRGLLAPRTYLEAIGIFLMVVIATFPVVAPFVLADNAAVAMHWSQAITLGMLFATGLALGRYAGHPRPAMTGLVAAILGALLIASVKALGG
jgi:VIT1/CCC1 family predicted Fe2+/Mn2+ transporter